MKTSQVQDQKSLLLQGDDLLISLRESEKGKDNLLTLSDEIAYIHDKQELLLVLQLHLKDAGFTTDIAVTILNEDRTSFRHFGEYPFNNNFTHTGTWSMIQACYPYPDGILEIVMEANSPLILYPEDLIKKERMPGYIKSLYEHGIREIIGISLRDSRKVIGVLFIFSDTKNEYTSQQLKLLQGIVNQVATAVAKILSIEARQEDEFERNPLLSICDDIAKIQDRDDLQSLIRGRLKELLPFSHGIIGILNKNNETFTSLLIDPLPQFAKSSVLDRYFKIGFPSKNWVIEKVLNADHPVLFDLDDCAATGDMPIYAQENYEAGMKTMAAVALRIKAKNLGFFEVFSDKKNEFSKRYLNIFQAVASPLSIALANILANEELLERENEKLMLLSLSSDITSCRTYKDIQNIVAIKIEKYFQFNEVLICLNNPDNLTHKCYAHTITQETMKHADFGRALAMNFFINDGIFNVIEDSAEPVVFNMEELVSRKDKPFYVDIWQQENAKEIIGFPLRMNNESIGVATLYPRENNTFTEAGLKLAQAICSYIGIALSNIRSYEKIQSQLEEIDQYKCQLEKENRYLQEQIQTKYNFEEVIGATNGLRNVFQMISRVAPTDSTVLIMGETGTGKELIATAIHNSSPRKDKLLVKVNCAALPSHLVESELFGHEKGSFTGATERRIGKFELAHNGSLFLDEIGELSLELQAKLLRALQEKEIERIGGNTVIKVNVRIIAASNRNLEKQAEAGKFRSDLFYRLNVFPIIIPPLKERREDIPMLVAHFIQKFSKKTGQKVKNVSPRVVQEMMLYDWPGNIRELEHLIERSILMTRGDTITDVHLLQGNKNPLAQLNEEPVRSLEENERIHIVSVLKKTRGRIRGAGGAAEILKVPPTTLHSKMKKLGIRKTGK